MKFLMQTNEAISDDPVVDHISWEEPSGLHSIGISPDGDVFEVHDNGVTLKQKNSELGMYTDGYCVELDSIKTAKSYLGKSKDLIMKLKHVGV